MGRGSEAELHSHQWDLGREGGRGTELPVVDHACPPLVVLPQLSSLLLFRQGHTKVGVEAALEHAVKLHGSFVLEASRNCISQGGKEDSIKDEVMIHAIRMLKDCRSDAVECSLMCQ